jgi:prohibitin 1
MNFAEAILNKIGAAGGALLVASVFLNKCVYFVDGGQRAMIFDRFKGVKTDVYGEGIHFVIPGLQWPIFFDIRTTSKTINSRTGTKDLQTVNIDLRILYKPDVEYLPTIYRNLGRDYEERVVPSIGNEVLKAVVAQYNAESLLTQREQVSKDIRERLTQRANEFHIILEDVAITHLAFGPEFTAACEQKQVAQQEAERAKFLVMQREQERLAAIIRAEGESEAARLISDAIKTHGNGLLEIRRIEAAKNIAHLLSKSPNITYVPGGNSNLLNIPIAPQ